MQQHRFTPTTFFIWSGLLIWAADFLFVYVFAAVACAQRFAGVRIAGFQIVPFVTTVASLAALLATAIVMQRALHRARRTGSDDPSHFIQFLSIALSALAIVAIAWSALPPLLLHTGCS